MGDGVLVYFGYPRAHEDCDAMQIRAGYKIGFECDVATPMLLMLSVHPSRAPDLLAPEPMTFDPPVTARQYRDGFGNVCTRIVAPPGRLTISGTVAIADSGNPYEVAPHAEQHPIEDLPNEALTFLLGSRYCETDRLSETAWSLFGTTPTGWQRVQSICDYVHDRLAFGYEHARPTRTAREAFMHGRGVCRDFAHLAVAFCRCMNIPARYCTGYLGDIGVPPVDRRWISAPGSMRISAANGAHSMRGIIAPESVVF